MMSLALLLACSPHAECELNSTVKGYLPTCEEAELVHYTGETRLLLPGEGGVITAYMPELVEEDVYGGTSGNYLQVILIYDDSSSEQASSQRGTTLTISALSEVEARLHLQFDFDRGALVGPLTVPVTDER